jgi:hypothetical protein
VSIELNTVCGVVVVHEGAGAVVDGFARQGHVVGVHDAVDEAHAHPARDQLGLAFAHRPQQPQIGVAIGRDGRRMSCDRVVGQLAQQGLVAARGRELEGADPKMAGGHASEHGAGLRA